MEPTTDKDIEIFLETTRAFKEIRDKKLYLVQSEPWDLYDMHGNIWEWCLDWYSGALPGGSVTDPRGPNTGAGRVHRGGSWIGGGWYCRSANRYDGWPDGDYSRLGFRAVLAPGQ